VGLSAYRCESVVAGCGGVDLAARLCVWAGSVVARVRVRWGLVAPRGGAANGLSPAPLRSHLSWLSKLPIVAGIVEQLVPDELWELFQRVVPEAPSRPQGGGRRRHGDREVLAAIVFVATSGCTWQQLPSASFGPSGATAHRRFTEWSKARVWAKLHRLVLDELGSRGELDWSRCAIDSVNMRALKRGS
jgi:transposase